MLLPLRSRRRRRLFVLHVDQKFTGIIKLSSPGFSRRMGVQRCVYTRSLNALNRISTLCGGGGEWHKTL